jgi:hypothetical protein
MSAQVALATPITSGDAAWNNFWIPQGVSPTRTYDCSYPGDSNYQGSTSNPFAYTFSALALPQFSLLVGVYDAPQTVTVSGDSGATYFYTLDGTTPTTSSTQYTAPIPLTTTTTVKAIAVEAGYQTSPVSEAVYTFAATPGFSVPSGKYTPGQTVTITDSTANATMYYTTDGSVPTVKSTKYTAPVPLSGNLTLKAMAVSSGFLNSAVASASYTTGQAATSITSLTVSANSVSTNQPVTLTATVIGSSPTGTVAFAAGSTNLGTASFTNGKATLQTSFATAGRYSITATYSGDANNAPSTSNTVTVAVGINLAVSKTSLAASASSVDTNQAVTLTATVTGSSPTGTVTFAAGSTNLGQATLGNGKATLQTAFPIAGSYPITAAYSGDDNNAPSTSSAVSLTVTPPESPSYSVSANPTTQTIAAGQSASYTITVTPSGGYSASTSFACSALPSEATCTFSPSAVTPSGSAATTKLSISTTAPSSSANHKPALWRPAGALVLAGLLGLFLRPRRARRWLRSLSCIALMVAAILGVAACGGGGGSTHTTNPGTPAGTYSVSVSATGSGAANQKLSISLVVQ